MLLELIENHPILSILCFVFFIVVVMVFIFRDKDKFGYKD